MTHEEETTCDRCRQMKHRKHQSVHFKEPFVPERYCPSPSLEPRMSLLSPSRTYYSEKPRLQQPYSGRHRINLQIGTEQAYLNMHLPPSRSFNIIMDELQQVLQLSEYQRVHTRIYLQTVLGETEVLVNSRPNYTTERAIDYIGIPANPSNANMMTGGGTVWFWLSLFFFLVALALGLFLVVEFFVLRPRLVAVARAGVPVNPLQVNPIPNVPAIQLNAQYSNTTKI